MTPVVIQPSEMKAFADAIVLLWVVTIVGVWFIQWDYDRTEWRVRRLFRRRRLRAIRARKAVLS